MNAKLLTPAEITALSTTGQREYAKAINVKRSASDTKATLAAKLLNRTLEIEKEQAPKAAAPAKATKRNLCTICKTRPVGTGKDAGYEDREFCKRQGFCCPCGNEAQHEISHLNGHESIPTDECWLCHPELNQASENYVAKQGGSKAGMTVIAKGDKIALVEQALKGMGATVKIQTKDGWTALVAQLDTAVGAYHIEAAWNGRAFHYPAASFNGKKFRNVSELFRMLGLS